MQAINTFVTLFAFAMAAPATVPVPPVCLWEVNNLGATVDVGTSLFLDGVHVSCGTTSKPFDDVYAKCKLAKGQVGAWTQAKSATGVQIWCTYNPDPKAVPNVLY